MLITNEAYHSRNTFMPDRRSRASCSIRTTSLPSTPSQANPFAHLTSRPLARPSCLHGKEKANPSGCPSAPTPSRSVRRSRPDARRAILPVPSSLASAQRRSSSLASAACECKSLVFPRPVVLSRSITARTHQVRSGLVRP